MGHATHFLQRLERLDDSHVELAMSLYRDTPLLKRILLAAKVPRDAERVALELTEGDAPPSLVVTRDGQFVTALGEGMRHGLPVISRRTLERVSEQVTELRERLERRRTLEERGHDQRLFRRLLDDADRLSRETFRELSLWSDLWARMLLQESTRLTVTTLSLQQRMSGSRRRPDYADALEMAWRTWWMQGSVMLLTAPVSRRLLEAAAQIVGKAPADPSDDFRAEQLLAMPATNAALTHLPASALRGAVAVGIVGKPALGPAKRLVATSTDVTQWTAALCSLVALGSRHQRLRAEVLKALSRPASSIDVAGGKEEAEQFVAELLAFARATLEDPDATERRVLGRGARIAVKLAEAMGAPAPFDFRSEGDVPADIALVLDTYWTGYWADTGEETARLFDSVSVAARREPEELFLPQAAIDALLPQAGPGDALVIQDRYERYFKKSRDPVVAPPRPGRNEPCPCDSGRKFKKCCGAG